MRTEDYIIIIIAVTSDSQNITITYTSTAFEGEVSVNIVYSNQQVITTFEHIKYAEKGTLTFPTAGLLPGTYTCNIKMNGIIKDSRSFSIV
jgi:hypothetical protein